MVEQEQFDAATVPGKHAEIDTSVAGGGAERGCVALKQFKRRRATCFRNGLHVDPFSPHMALKNTL
jgi:hypothetical protein